MQNRLTRPRTERVVTEPTTAKPVAAVVAVVLTLVLGGCGATEAPSTDATVDTVRTATPQGDTSTGTEPGQTGTDGDAAVELEPPTTVATSQVSALAVHDEPGGEVSHTLDHPNHNGVPLTLMVVEEQDGWVQVQLPVRPNGTTGWVAADDVTLSAVPYRIEVSVADKELVLLRNGLEMHRFPVATGTGDTPTPTGTYYLTELLEPLNTGYGPFAYGLSAFSDVINDFGGGPGQIGLHGTDDEGTIGQDVSHGCIRLANSDITTLAQILPLGTPITIS